MAGRCGNATDYYPFGMPMPGRNGYTSQSISVPGRGFVAGTDYPDYLGVSSRLYTRQPGVYRAVREVELLPGFEIFTDTDELTIETSERNSNGEYVLSTDYPGGFPELLAKQRLTPPLRGGREGVWV